MSTKTLYRLSALAGIFSGLCIIIGKFLIPLPNRQIGEIFDFFSPFFALLFAVGLYLRHRRESGVFGGMAFILLFIGLATVVSLDYFGAFIALISLQGWWIKFWKAQLALWRQLPVSLFSSGRYSLAYL